MMTTLKYIAIAGAAGGLAAVYILNGWWSLALPIAAVGLLWALGSWRGWRWPAGVGLFLLVGAAGLALWLGMGLWEAFLAIVAALSAWDLDCAHDRFREAPRTAAVVRLERSHLLRLLLVDGVSIAIAGVATAFRLQLGVGLAILLGVLAVCGVGEAVAFLRRESD
jgi:hypothetical protein